MLGAIPLTKICLTNIWVDKPALPELPVIDNNALNRWWSALALTN